MVSVDSLDLLNVREEKKKSFNRVELVAVFVLILALVGIFWYGYSFSESGTFSEVREERDGKMVTVRHFDSGPLQGCERFVESGELLCP